MPRKKTPEQETESIIEEQEQETVPEEEPEDTIENQEQPDEENSKSEEQLDENQDAETTEEENPQEATQETELVRTDESTAVNEENATLREALLQAQGRLAAYSAGVTPDMIDDAVTLAMAEASKTGEVTEASVATAMDVVLKRHPEWKATGADKKKTGGFKIGADRDSVGMYKKQSGTTNQSVKRWNRFK